MSRKTINGESEYYRLKRENAQAQRTYAAARHPDTVPARTVHGTGAYVPPVWHVREGAGQVAATELMGSV